MSDKRYFKRMWEEEYYIFDSKTISESDFEEKLEYQDYKTFEDSMMGDEVVNRLNEQHEQIQELIQSSKEFEEDCQSTFNAMSRKQDDLYRKNFKLKEENEKLKERNKRQAKHLAELYELMAKKDWESLTEIIDDFCSCEEQLQREWKCYE